MSNAVDEGVRDQNLGARIREFERRIQNGVVLHVLGLTPEDREQVLARMFMQDRRDAVGYWLQLLLSMGIATLGLVLGSTAVVIGAMLIAPLMGPILELGMALVVSSPALTVRSTARVLGSVVAVAGGAALLTMSLPFHEVNAEIASRTLPTALDLLIAVMVALAAAFTTVRSRSETTSAAAGAAIGIALVPPLCVMGFGLGIGSASVAGGASLLFLTNFTAILFISAGSFWVAGFEQVDVGKWEAAALASARAGGPMHRAMRRVQGIFQARYGRVLRVSIPVVLFASVFSPLRQALDQVAWEVKARSSVARILDQSIESQNAVQSVVRVKQNVIAVQLYLVGSGDEAAALERDLTTKIAAATSVVPNVRVIAVPDQVAIRQLSAAQSSREPETMTVGADLSSIRQQLAAGLRSAWPSQQLGQMHDWVVQLHDSTGARLVVSYWGQPASPAADEVLSRVLSERVAMTVRVDTRPLADTAMTVSRNRGLAWLPTLIRALDLVSEIPNTYACLNVPTRLDGNAMLGLVRAEVARVPEGRATMVSSGNSWSVRLSPQPCAQN